MWRRLKHFYQYGLWEADLRRASTGERLFYSALRVAADATRAFFVDLGGLRASGLTLVTVLALVPLLAMATGIANGLGYGTVLDAQIERFATGLPEGMQPAMQKVRELVQRTSFAALGAIGSLLVAYSGMRLFVRVEDLDGLAARAIDDHHAPLEGVGQQGWVRAYGQGDDLFSCRRARAPHVLRADVQSRWHHHELLHGHALGKVVATIHPRLRDAQSPGILPAR